MLMQVCRCGWQLHVGGSCNVYMRVLCIYFAASHPQGIVW